LPQFSRIRTLLCLAGLLSGVSLCGAQAGISSLQEGFLHPPESAKPRTWWHWTGGNVTLTGITKDLEWMKSVGIGGEQMTDVSFGYGQTVPEKLIFETPAWLDAVRHAALESQRLGLEMSIFSSAGWSEAGGPWVRPEQAMKKLVWSETDVEGPSSFSARLPQPPDCDGPIRDQCIGNGSRSPAARPLPTYYHDIAVLAYRTPAAADLVAQADPQVTSSAGPIDAQALLDDSLQTRVTIPAPADGSPAWIQFTFASPYTARAFSLGSHGGIPVGKLLASDDGTDFRTIAVLPGPQGYHGAQIRTFAFPAVTARVFRLELTGAPLAPAAVIHSGPVLPAKQFTLTEAKLYSEALVNRWEDKGTYGSLMDTYLPVPTPPAAGDAEIAKSTIVDLTARMSADGTLHWDVPQGRWTILRFGFSLTGATNHPAMPTGFGLEVDKLNSQDVEDYFHGYMDPILHALGPLAGSTLRYMTMDSWEAGMQNWTDDMIHLFRERRGYDPTPYLPVLAGRVVENADVSDRFLWDYRRTLADLYAEGYYGTMEKMLRQHHMGSYAEASGVALEIPEDTLLNKSEVDIPMGEFWVHALHPEPMYYVDVRGAASAAHVYGKPIVATESFTGGGYEAPYTLKKVADYWFAQGVNRLVFHTSAEQPLDTKPGNVMVGTNLNRNITWADEASPFMTYVARTSYLLQQGQYFADIAYLFPEGAPSTPPFWGPGLRPAPPSGYDFDWINTDILLHHTSVGADGRIQLSDGMNYRILVLPKTDQMTPEVLREIHELVADGAVVVGARPRRSPSLAGYPQADAEVNALATDLWGDMDGITDNRHTYGKGQVIWGLPLEEVLSSMNVPRDFECNCSPQMAINWIHRRADGAGVRADRSLSVGQRIDIYYVSNGTDAEQAIDARFRVTGAVPRVWHADTGAIDPVSYSIADGFTTVPLRLAERESVFVVFEQSPSAHSATIPVMVPKPMAQITTPWDVKFPPNLGAPDRIHLTRLASWTEDARPGVKYFSGTAVYTTTFTAPASWFHAGQRLALDLGDVRDLAKITLNGKELGVLWKPPYRVDASAALRPGRNVLEVAVTNEWTNRIVGDRQLPPESRILPGDMEIPPMMLHGPFAGPSEPLPSGLLGPVEIDATVSAPSAN
jgi:hypothetical protein